MISFGKDAMELHDIVAVWCAIENPPERDEISEKGDMHMPVLNKGWGAVRRKFEIERYVKCQYLLCMHRSHSAIALLTVPGR